MLAAHPRPDHTADNRPARIIVPQTASTTNDLVTRVLAPHFAARLGRPFLVENRVGASGMIGMDIVAKSTPDNLTLLNNVSNTLALPFLYKNLPFDILEDFEPVGIEGYGNHALVVHASVPVANVADFVAYAKANPGKLDYAAPGLGTHHHLGMLMIQAMAGVQLTPVFYKGSAGAIADAVAGQVKAAILPMQIAVAHHDAGNLKVLGGTRKERFPLFPDIPSLHEQGLRDFDVEPWFALWASRNTSSEWRIHQNQVLNDAISDPQVRDALAAQGLVATPGSIDDLKRKASVEHAMWRRALAKMGVEPE